MNLPACLIIMDGFGLAEPGPANAISLADTPCLDKVFAEHPMTRLEASGEAVGLPDAQMGNSEVGHLNIGAGRIVFQELTKINRACRDGSLAQNKVLNDAFESAKKEGRALHFMGLLSDGGVHSSNRHLYALLDHAAAMEVSEIYIHCFMDGRDVSPTSGKGFIAELEEQIGLHDGDASKISIGSIMGRYYAMDRDNRWDRVEQAYTAMTYAEPFSDLTPQEVMGASYANGITDEFVVPVALNHRGIKSGDSLVFFNFRPDRAREITRAFVDDDFRGFPRKEKLALSYVCLTEYDPTIDAPVAFTKEFPEEVLADVLAEAGLRQYHIAETEKYAHVTFFLNGGREEPKAGETRKLIASPKVSTYDLQPEMSAPEVADTLAAAIENDESDVYIVNFANCDMVGHTGIVDAAAAAVEAVDAGVCKVLRALKEKHGFALLTADHGNAEKMSDEQGNMFTAHSTAPVPLAMIDYTGTGMGLADASGTLGNIAPTFLEAIGIEKPALMNEESLLAK